jgi:hypothetical protein
MVNKLKTFSAIALCLALTGAWPNTGSKYAGVASGVATTLDPSKTNAHVILSGGNLIALADSSGTIGNSLSINGHSTGKFYAEATITTIAVGGYFMALGFGIATSYSDTAGIGNNGTDNAGWWVDASDSNFYQNGNVGTTTNMANVAAGDIVGIAVDLTNKKIWFRDNNQNSNEWDASGTANPATNTGGIDISPSLSGSPTEYFAVLVTSSNKIAMNFGNTSYNAAAPAGFSNW